MTIYIENNGAFLYTPKEEDSRLLMQHCIGAELESLNQAGLDKVTAVAYAHGWAVSVKPSKKVIDSL